MSKSTIFEVAQAAGVSIKTVSRVVNREPNVRESTRTRVNAAITKLNYRPNLSARNLASHRSHLILLVYDDPGAYEIPSSGYIIDMQQGVLSACKSSNYDLLIYPCNYREKDAASKLKDLITRTRADGVVLGAPLSNMSKLVRTVGQTGTPLASISPGKQGSKQYTVATNDREVCSEMTQYLASLGHRKIAFIIGHHSHEAVADRFLGYQDGLRESGLRFSSRLAIEGDNSIGSGEACASKLLKRADRPTAIFAANDDMAAGVIRVADRMGIAVPEQLSVVGFDDFPLARQIYPALTTIKQPVEAMTQLATEMLIEERKAGFTSQRREIIPAALQIRDSTGPAPSLVN